MTRDYSLDLARIAAGIAAQCLGGLPFQAAYSPDGNQVIMTFHNYPLYGSDKKGDACVVFPRSTFYVRRGNVKFTPLQQAQCRFYQQSTGQALAHPHIFSDGHPCWHGGSRERVADFIANIVETLSLQNVTEDSVLVGLCASGVMGVGMRALENARAQQKKLMEELGCLPLITDHRKLERYIDNRWCSKITILMKAA